MVRFGGISGSFGLAMGILARLRLAKIRTMARPNSPDMPPKRTKKVRLGIFTRLPSEDPVIHFSQLIDVLNFAIDLNSLIFSGDEFHNKAPL